MPSIYQSFVKEVVRDLYASEKRLRTKAAQHLKAKMKAKVNDQYFKGHHSPPGSPPGKMSGDLIKGIMYQHDGDETKIGVGPPAFRAHLMEFGTTARFAKTWKGKALKKARYSGRVLPRPFVQPTFEEEAGAVKAILSERWA